MLKFLHIENIAVIESADLEPVNGFSVLTGETGAGKSIIIDSINAVLGERTSRELVRNSAEKAVVSAVFGNISKSALSLLGENGITPDEDGNVVINKVINAGGNSSIRINGQLTTAQVVRDVSKYLINIHGQHDSQMLLRPENHYLYIDLVASNEDIRKEYTSCFKNFNDIRKKIKELEMDEDEKYARIDLLKFQINELELADIKPGEIEELKKTRELINNSEKLLSSLNECVHMLNGSVESDGAATLARAALTYLEKASTDDLKDVANMLSEASENLQSVADSVRKYITDFPYSAADKEKVDERLDLLSRLMLKYGNSEENALTFLANAKTELEKIEFGEEEIARLEEELVKAQERLVSAGKKLTESRKKAAENFTAEVCDNLKFMDMSGVEFIVDIKEAKYSKTGCDQIEFLISANAGESVKPLYKVASGGELSRIMLAIKSIIADKDSVDTLIFDEIDTGISGRVASKVAVQLRKVSKLRQVICVTHLAQIAAAGEGHFLIEKSVKDGKTYTNVSLLNEEERIKEIGRIMSGADLTENTISSAKELLDRSKM